MKIKVSSIKNRILSQSTQEAGTGSIIYQEEKRDLNQEREELLVDGLKDYLKARKDFAYKIFWLVVMWLIFISVIIILIGVQVLKLSDTVLVTLISTTTVNVAAFLVVVANFLFPKTDKDILDKLSP